MFEERQRYVLSCLILLNEIIEVKVNFITENFKLSPVIFILASILNSTGSIDIIIKMVSWKSRQVKSSRY